MFARMKTSIAAGPFAEPVMGLTMVMIGVALALPGETFERRSFATMAHLAPELVWAAVFILLGGAQIVGALLVLRQWRLLSCMASGALWVLWTASTLHAGFGGVLWAIGIAMTTGQAVAYLRAASAPGA